MRGVVPVAIGSPQMPVPLLLCAHHGLLMAGAHHDPVFVRDPRSRGIVLGEGVVPHGGPQVVALHAQNDFEDFGIERAVEVRGGAAGDSVFAELRAHPKIEVGLFVVKENAPIFDAGLTLLVPAGANVERGLMPGRDVRPPVPG